MTWFKFERTVLPDAEKIELFAPYQGNYEARLGPLHADGPGIFKWDNPYSVYVYHGGSFASGWNLSGRKWVPVVGISPRPNEWGKKQEYLGEGLLLILEDCIDLRLNQGNALFPETLKADLHGVRSVIEAYSKTATITRGDGPYACGLGINKSAANCHLRVFASGGWQEYKIDRWD